MIIISRLSPQQRMMTELQLLCRKPVGDKNQSEEFGAKDSVASFVLSHRFWL